MNILYIIHYGYTIKEFYCDKYGNPKKIIGDGGSNIHIHLIEYLSRKNKITISTFKNNYQINAFFKKNSRITIKEINTPGYLFGKYNFLLGHFYKIIVFPIKAFFTNASYEYVFSMTDFLPDVIFPFILKIRNKNIIWIASYFLEAPKPWDKENPYKKNIFSFFIGLTYWFFQQISYWLINSKADYILVTSKPDVLKFVNNRRDKNKIIIAIGGVDIKLSVYKNKKEKNNLEKRKYDACFLGRLHPQKGCLELIEIWKKVIKQKKNAKLAIIGNGSLKEKIEEEINKNKLKENIELLGFKYGEEKNKIFNNSRIILHPAIYDSGGMSAAEGMAWGLPAVGFDLESLKSYYPKGMIKIKKYNLDEFSQAIISLLNNKNYYDRISGEAFDLIKNGWSWEKRISYISKQIFTNKYE